MKGFLGALLVFIFWASGGLYYIKYRNITTLNSAQVESHIHIKDRVNSKSTESNAPSNGLTAENEATVSIVNDTSEVSKNVGNSKLLAQELKKSITISDTIDIDNGEPAVQYEKEILLGSGKGLSSRIFYPIYTTKSELILDKELIDYGGELKQLLKEYPEKRVTIIGHTDDVGSARDNFTIGLKKSRQVKWYLTARIGIARKYITAISRGEEEPIESNASKWGRNKNNRIQIIVD